MQQQYLRQHKSYGQHHFIKFELIFNSTMSDLLKIYQ